MPSDAAHSPVASVPHSPHALQAPRLTIVLPAYNEAAILEANLAQMLAYLRGLSGETWEIVVVNDGSKDETGAIANALADEHPEVRVVHHATNMQLGQAIRTGFANARGEIIVVMDIDLSYTPDHIERLVGALESSAADIVIASPYMEGGEVKNVPAKRLRLSRYANKFIGMVAPGRIQTFTGMVRAYRAEFVRALSLKSIGMEINTEIIYKAIALRARIEEIPAKLEWLPEPSEESDAPAVRKSSMHVPWQTLATLFSGFIFRPFMFFLVPAVAIGLFSSYALFWCAVHTWTAWGELGHLSGFFARATEALRFAYQAHEHTFVIGSLSGIVAIQLLSLGFVSMQQKRYFEELFYQSTELYRRREGRDG